MGKDFPRTARADGFADNLRWFMLATARIKPDHPAVVELDADGELRTVTYRELERLTDAYAAELADLGLDVGDRVVVASTTSASSIAMLLACATLGLPFIPVSPEIPVVRVRAVIDAARPALYVHDLPGQGVETPPEVGVARFAAGALALESPPEPRVRRRREVLATDTAYIIFTSGTTGRPKGVVMNHRANIAFYRGTLHQGVVADHDRVGIASPFHFDFCLGGIGLTLGQGATVVPIPRSRLDWPRLFLALLRDAEVTHVQGVPSIWGPVLRHEPDLLAGLDRLERVLFSGEDFPLAELRRLQRLRPKTRLINCYGATESMACSFTDVPRPMPEDLDRLSIGFAHPGAEMLLIGADGGPVEEPGTVGEIYLDSPALFTAYWDDPEATGAALVPHPFTPQSGRRVLRTGDLAHRGVDGELYFRGRGDSQVQIRGNRVELGELERRLAEFPGVATAVALVLPKDGDEAELAACVIMKREAPPLNAMELRAFCADALPGYMVPRGLHVVEDVPTTANGKVDRDALAARLSLS
ncbi:AMP-binding protein [Nonomuraea sp. NPDC048916]|uniref:AMP-binding protein n=1 Tax=Nonomuraea sp. NPDC048916 TaxID=3154232 RepID=UPI0033E03ACC